MSAVPLNVVDHVARNLLVPIRCQRVESQVAEGVVLKQLFQFEFFSILPPPVSLALVNKSGLVMTPGNLMSILVTWAVAEVLESNLVDHAPNYLLPLGNTLAPSPSGFVK